jgi:outer membrane receptor protein involved in Fe transport
MGRRHPLTCRLDVRSTPVPRSHRVARASRRAGCDALRRLALAAVLAPGLAAGAEVDAKGEDAATLAPVSVIGVTPLPGLDLPQDRIAAPVQSATSSQIERSGALSIADFMNRRFGSVHVNEIQGNPFQPDVSFRGYTASPLLGTPQGLSVYVDGVRLNQPFGDIVSWDLLPRSAIASIALMPGSNPLFGLNTLGGALAVRTKDGWSHPGTSLQLTTGSHARAQAELESGGSNALGLAWYGTANVFRDSGWRDDSPSRLGQVFAKLGWRSGATQATLTASAASTDLHGNGLQDGQLLAGREASVYTRPDQTRNRAGLLSLALSRELSDRWSVSGHVYLRRIDTRTLNGDINDDSLDQDVYTLSAADRGALAGAGIAAPAGVDPATTPFPSLRCIAQALQGADIGLACNGLVNRSHSRQTNGGIAAQASGHLTAGATTHQVVLGAAFDASRSRFSQTAQAGFIEPDRSVVGVDAFLRGRGAAGVDDSLAESEVGLSARTRTASVFGADTVSLPGDVHLTIAARYDRTTVRNRDALRSAPDPASLDGDHVFSRLNPAIGLNWNPARGARFYAGYNEGSRTPTAIELGCANPEQPCKLPNALAGDPALKQVVARTIEAGVTGQAGAATTWRAGVFRGSNQNDLLFVSSDASGHGYFRNFGRTRRQGIELGAATAAGPVSLDLAWTLLDARFRSRERVSGAGNSSNDNGPGLDGSIAIRPGDRLPLVPRQIFKAGLAWAVDARTRLDADLVAVSTSTARGNENGAHVADGTVYLGPGRSAGYGVVNFGMEVQATRGLAVLGRIGNVFARRYATAAQLGATGFDASGRFVAQPLPADADGRFPLRGSTFFAPGAPRLFTVGIRCSFD